MVVRASSMLMAVKYLNEYVPLADTLNSPVFTFSSVVLLPDVVNAL